MSNDLVPQQDVPRESAGDTERFNANMEDLKAGQYWQTSVEVPPLIKQRKSSHYDWDARKDVPTVHDYTERGSIEAGVVLLVKQLRYDDRGVHTVVVAAHPLWKNISDLRFLVSEFYEYFERCFNAEEVRAAERASVEGRLQVLQQELIQGPPREEAVALLGHQASLTSKPSVDVMVQHAQSISTLKEKTTALAETAKKHTTFIESKTREIATTTQLLVGFYSEQAAAQLASVNDVISYAKELEKGVQSLSLYTGENVEVNTWSTGEGADPSEKIHLFQDKLFLDEEFMIHLHDGGFDSEKMSQFVERLTTDTALRDRILPYPRTVVLARPRRKGKIYSTEPGLAGAMYNAWRNQENFSGFLIIRNGDNIYQVWSELSTDKAGRLFPSLKDADQIFRGVDGSTLSIDDLTYTDAKEKHDDYALFYRRMLLLLWGLNDRLNLFGDFYDQSTYRGFFDLKFQMDHFEFIHGDVIQLGTRRPTYSQWFQEMNAMIQSGSRVLINLPAIWGSEQVPAAYSAGEHGSRIWKWSGPEAQLLTVKRTGSEYYVEVPGVYDGWRESSRTPMMKVFFQRGINNRHANDDTRFAYLVLDGVKPDDIEYYKNSRSNRYAYAQYMETLFKIEALAKEQFALEEPMKAYVEQALAAGRIKIPAGTNLRETIDHAVRLWRATRRGAEPPNPGEDSFNQAAKAIMDSTYQLLGAGFDPVEHIHPFIQEQGLTPIRFVMTGQAKFALYAVTPLAEQDNRFFDHPWVTRISLERGKEGFREYSRKLVLLPKVSAEEVVVQAWPEAEEDWGDLSKRPVPDDLTSAKIDKAISDIDFSVAANLELFEGKFDWDHEYRRVTSWARRESRKSVVLPRYLVPVGIVATQQNKGYYYDSDFKKFRTVCVQQSALPLLYRHGDQEQRDKLVKFIRSIFANPESHVKTLERQGESTPSITILHGIQNPETLCDGGWTHSERKIPTRWQEWIRTHCHNKGAQIKVDGVYVDVQLPTFPEVVRYFPAASVQWLNDNSHEVSEKEFESL